VTPEQKLAVKMSLDKFGKAQVKAGGYSMWPFITPNNIIHITAKIEPPYFGKVAVFWAQDQLIAHRIVGQKKEDSPTKAKNGVVFKIAADFIRNSQVFIPAHDLIGTVTKIQACGNRKGNIKGHLMAKVQTICVKWPWAGLTVFLSPFLRVLTRSTQKLS